MRDTRRTPWLNLSRSSENSPQRNNGSCICRWCSRSARCAGSSACFFLFYRRNSRNVKHEKFRKKPPNAQKSMQNHEFIANHLILHALVHPNHVVDWGGIEVLIDDLLKRLIVLSFNLVRSPVIHDIMKINPQGILSLLLIPQQDTVKFPVLFTNSLKFLAQRSFDNFLDNFA